MFWEELWNFLSVQEHREEISIHDVGVAKSVVMRKLRALQEFSDHMALRDPLGVLLKASWVFKHTVEIY